MRHATALVLTLIASRSNFAAQTARSACAARPPIVLAGQSNAMLMRDELDHAYAPGLVRAFAVSSSIRQWAVDTPIPPEVDSPTNYWTKLAPLLHDAAADPPLRAFVWWQGEGCTTGLAGRSHFSGAAVGGATVRSATRASGKAASQL